MKITRTSLILAIASIIIVIASSCKKDETLNCEETPNVNCTSESTAVNLRIKNVSQYDFADIVLNPSGGEKSYGALSSGATSDYQAFAIAYNYAYVKLTINNEEFILQPIDYVGEQPLCNGDHTYSIDVIDFDNRQLSIQVD